MPCECESRERHEWFPMYALDFLNSDTAEESEPWETQAYLHMLVLAWARPGVPAKPELLAKKLGLDALRVAELLSGPVGEKWQPCSCGKSLWNERMEAERATAQGKRDERRAEKVEAGRRGGLASGRARRAKQNEAEGSNPKQSEAPAKQNEADASTTQRNEATEQYITLQDTTETTTKARRRASGGEPSGKRSTVGRQELQALCAAQALPDDVGAAAEAWRAYRAEAGLKAWTTATWSKQLVAAARDPTEFVASVEHSVAQGYQGLFPPKGGPRSSGPRGAAATNQAREAKNYQEADDEWRYIAGATSRKAE